MLLYFFTYFLGFSWCETEHTHSNGQKAVVQYCSCTKGIEVLREPLPQLPLTSRLLNFSNMILPIYRVVHQRWNSQRAAGNPTFGQIVNWLEIQLTMKVETYGAYGPQGIKLVKQMSKKIQDSTGEKLSSFYLFQSISMAIQKGNAQCVTGCVKDGYSGLEGLFSFHMQ